MNHILLEYEGLISRIFYRACVQMHLRVHFLFISIICNRIRQEPELELQVNLIQDLQLIAYLSL